MKNMLVKKWTAIAAIFLLVSCHSGEKRHLIDVNEVQTKAGMISGKTTEDQVVKIFNGVPFAAPPVGDLRWKAPQAVAAWEGVRACIDPPASAIQAKPEPFFCWSKEFLAPEEPISEDCLYLNIWTAAQTDQDKLPVIVWIHGGAFTGGSGTVPLYDGENMARKGVVFVTINYRLGIFGFLAHPELSAESENHISGNYGILDQIAALKWVQENIAAFGGDPACVTVAGQSAGAFSVNLLVVSPMAKGLFRQAIAQSGGMFGKKSSRGQTLSAAEENGKRLTDQLGVTSIQELRSLSADSVFKLPGRYSVTIDSVLIPPVQETFAAGKQNDVALISGWNAEDGGSANITPDQKLMAALSFGWQNYTWARLQTKTGTGKAYLYYFKRVPPGEPNYGAFHSAEFGYALHTLHKWDRPFTDVDYRLEEMMSSYWVNFAKTGNPNGEGLPVWPTFNESAPEIIELGDEIKATPLPFQEQLYALDENNK